MKERKKPADRERSPEFVLDDREARVLRSIIRAHILSGDPISSKAVSKGTRLQLSPASIRGVMAMLEERGWLLQPHTSAGRVPTDQAYRWFVDRMVASPSVPASQAQAIDAALDGSSGEIDDLLEEASRQLSSRSNQVGLVLTPRLDRLVIEHLEFVRLDARRVVAIVVGRSGVVHNRILNVAESPAQSELDWAGRYLSDEFQGRTLPRIREILRRRMAEDRAAYDRLLATSLELGRQTVDAEEAEQGVFVDGASNLLSCPEFADLDKIRSLMQTLERKRALVDLLGRVLDDAGVQVVIGDEQGATDLADCSLVAANYGVEGHVVGTLGIVGPKRMEYALAIGLVDHLARVLGRYLSSGIDEKRRRSQIP